MSDVDERLSASCKTTKGLRVRQAIHRGHLAIKTTGRISFICVQEIDWMQAADQYIPLSVGKKAHLLRKSMNAVEQSLPPDKFCRVHRSAIVNLERVEELRPTAGRRLRAASQ